MSFYSISQEFILIFTVYSSLLSLFSLLRVLLMYLHLLTYHLPSVFHVLYIRQVLYVGHIRHTSHVYQRVFIEDMLLLMLILLILVLLLLRIYSHLCQIHLSMRIRGKREKNWLQMVLMHSCITVSLFWLICRHECHVLLLLLLLWTQYILISRWHKRRIVLLRNYLMGLAVVI